MLGRISLLMDQIVQEQEKKRLYELDALQAQINPHFLYNTLDSIVWMQERGQNQDAIVMVIRAGQALSHLHLQGPQRSSPSHEELEHVRNYLIIQSDALQGPVHLSTSKWIRRRCKLRTVKLILQPLVENAIVHGSRTSRPTKGALRSPRRWRTAALCASRTTAWA